MSLAHWFIDTASIGGLMVIVVAGLVLTAYVGMVRWIASAPRDGSLPAEDSAEKRP
jgi:hypothetical protein